MHSRRLISLSALAALGACLSLDASALGLGRAHGAVLVGRPLNVAITATIDGDEPDTQCMDADVFQGDTRVNSRRVTVRWEPGGNGSGTVRILSDLPVQEPVVTVYLRVGCANRITRRYVLLSEQPPESEPALPVVRTPSIVAVPRPAAPPAATTRAAPPAALPAPQALPGAEPLRIRPEPKIAGTKPARRPEASRGEPSSVVRAKPHLKLEPLDLTADRDPTLRSTNRLAALPAADDARRAQAAAMWRVLSAGPEEALRNAQRIAALEDEMRALRELVTKNTSGVSLMREQAEKARTERNTMATLALGLGIALLLAIAAAAWALRARWSQPRAGAAWWGGRPVGEGEEEVLESGFSQPAARSGPRSGAAAIAARNSDAPDIDLSEHAPLEASSRPSVPSVPRASVPSSRPAASRWSNSDFQSSILGSSRNVKAEELIDIQQQADFFLSIGQADRAIALLENHVQQQGETSALAWLDLLEIYHDLARREDFDRIRADFQERFNVQVPEFDDYRRESAGLENYSRALSRIESLWPQQRVLEVIEESLLRKPGGGDTEGFDLEAYRELVLLYNIAKDVATHDEPEATEPPPREDPASFFATQVQPLSALHPRGMSEEPTDFLELQRPFASSNLGVDIDLEFLDPPPGATPAPAPTEAPKEEPLIDLDSLDWRSLRR
jgi:hypothetical protein